MTHHRHFISLIVAWGLVLPAFADEPPLPTPVVGSANAKVLVQRGSEFIPPTPNMPLQQTDRIVVLEGGSLQVGCDGSAVATFNAPGVFPVPACPSRVAGGTPAPVQTLPASAPASASSAGMSGGTKTTLAVVGGVAVVALAAAGGGGGGNSKPVSP